MKADIQTIKQRFEIIGNTPALNRALEIASQVAITDMSVLVTGESGVGKEVFSKIIHQQSPRKHNKYIAVNCGAIPEGTIESELFGHVKGAFTNAERDRKGYFAEANQGTIFLDEVAELPLSMQVKLLRVLESGEFLPVGSSVLQKSDVRIVAATNVDLVEAIRKGKFREDLYYRLNQISIFVPPLRERKEDIYLLWRKFAVTQADRYRMPVADLTPDAKEYLEQFPWYGNVRQLKNIAEQISIIETKRPIDKHTLEKYIPTSQGHTLPAIWQGDIQNQFSERELLLKALNVNRMLGDMRAEINELKAIINSLIHSSQPHAIIDTASIALHAERLPLVVHEKEQKEHEEEIIETVPLVVSDSEEETPSLSLAEKEKETIEEALRHYKGRRKLAAKELGISERTLYRKIKEYDLEL